eukprot:3411859-Karenia_brevis.AAC.1
MASILAKPTVRVGTGQKLSLTLMAKGWERMLHPAYDLHAKVILEWASSIWTNWPEHAVMDRALQAAYNKVEGKARPWAAAADSATTFLLTCA